MASSILSWHPVYYHDIQYTIMTSSILSSILHLVYYYHGCPIDTGERCFVSLIFFIPHMPAKNSTHTVINSSLPATTGTYNRDTMETR